jgi:hypothetical protein
MFSVLLGLQEQLAADVKHVVLQYMHCLSSSGKSSKSTFLASFNPFINKFFIIYNLIIFENAVTIPCKILRFFLS